MRIYYTYLYEQTGYAWWIWENENIRREQFKPYSQYVPKKLFLFEMVEMDFFGTQGHSIFPNGYYK